MSDYEMAPCPRCGTQDAEKLSFTWWGGLLGPKLLNHVRCHSCGQTYNGKTGQLNTVGIAIYVAVGAAIAVAVIALLVMSR